MTSTFVIDANGNIKTGGTGGSALAIEENDVSVVAAATTLNFVDLNVEDAGSNQANVYLNLPAICNGRLTLTSATYVTTADVTSSSSLYFCGPGGGTFYISLYDGTRWKFYSSAQISLALSGLTSGKNYDVFIYDNAGTLTLELSAAWTNDTTRADALTTQNGIYVKSGATTRRWLGTIRTTGTNTTADSETYRYVSNYYNRVQRRIKAVEATNSWTTAGGTGKHAWNASTANRVEFVQCDSERPVRLFFSALHSVSGSGGTGEVDIGLDSTTAGSATIKAASNSTPSILTVATAEYYGYPSTGYHYLQLLELDAGVNTTFYGDINAPTNYQYGAQGELWG